MLILYFPLPVLVQNVLNLERSGTIFYVSTVVDHTFWPSAPICTDQVKFKKV